MPSAERIAADPSLAPFNLEATRIDPIGFNIDTNRLEYEYFSRPTKAQEFFATLDARALDAGWQKHGGDDHSHAYTKVENVSPARDANRLVRVSFTPAEGRVRVVAEVVRWIDVSTKHE